MYLWPTELRASEIHGIGVFAKTDIPIGSLVWRKNSFVDLDIPAKAQGLLALPKFVRDNIEAHSTVSEDGEVWEVALDDDSFTNHSETPNLIYHEGTNTFIAQEHIRAGDELTKDYRTFSYSDYDKSL